MYESESTNENEFSSVLTYLDFSIYFCFDYKNTRRQEFSVKTNDVRETGNHT